MNKPSILLRTEAVELKRLYLAHIQNANARALREIHNQVQPKIAAKLESVEGEIRQLSQEFDEGNQSISIFKYVLNSYEVDNQYALECLLWEIGEFYVPY